MSGANKQVEIPIPCGVQLLLRCYFRIRQNRRRCCCAILNEETRFEIRSEFCLGQPDSDPVPSMTAYRIAREDCCC
jgi:hypothetical protein